MLLAEKNTFVEVKGHFPDSFYSQTFAARKKGGGYGRDAPLPFPSVVPPPPFAQLLLCFYDDWNVPFSPHVRSQPEIHTEGRWRVETPGVKWEAGSGWLIETGGSLFLWETFLFFFTPLFPFVQFPSRALTGSLPPFSVLLCKQD